MDNKIAMSSYKAQVDQYGTPISIEKFKELRDYANKRGIKLSGFKDFVGDIEVIKTVINDICEIAEDFPDILDAKKGIWLELDYNLGTDFATTESGHIIHLNAVYFSNLNMMIRDYDECVSDGRFVKGTDWRAISRHEVGHVVAAMYGIEPMKVAKAIMNTSNKAEVLYRIGKELSLYSAEFEDGREIISESFSGCYSCTGNDLAEHFVDYCLELLKKEGEIDEVLQ